MLHSSHLSKSPEQRYCLSFRPYLVFHVSEKTPNLNCRCKAFRLSERLWTASNMKRQSRTFGRTLVIFQHSLILSPFIINCLRGLTDGTEVTKQRLRTRSTRADLSTRSLDFNGNPWSVPDFVGKTVRKQVVFLMKSCVNR